VAMAAMSADTVKPANRSQKSEGLHGSAIQIINQLQTL
jgi:hypothetical protein